MFWRKRNDNGNGNGNGHGAGVDVLGDDSVLNETHILTHDEDGGGVRPDEAARTDEKRRRGVPAPLIALLLILSVGVFGFLYVTGFFSDRKTASVQVAAPTQTRNEVADSAATDKEISTFAQQLDAPQTPPTAGQPAQQAQQAQPAAANGAQTPNIFAPAPYDPSMPVTSTAIPGVTVPNSVAGTVESQPANGTAQTQAAAPSATGARPSTQTTAPLAPIESEPAQQRSRYSFRTPPPAASTAAQPSAGAGRSRSDEWWPQQWVGGDRAASGAAAPAAPAVPPFGAELAVRSLGAIYSLRSDAYAKFELLRDVKGEGWSLKRGTKFIGRVSGSENDRAFVKIMGFIDPATKKLVLVGGEVKGVDGGDGLKGSRKRVGKLLGRIMQEAYRSGVQLTSAWLGGRGGGSQIYLPNASEIPGMGGQNAARLTEYVKVKAGTLGSVMITDLPETVRGTQPAGQLADDGDSMAEDELIELLNTGTPDEVRAAFPRMSPQLRQLAEIALREGGRQN